MLQIKEDLLNDIGSMVLAEHGDVLYISSSSSSSSSSSTFIYMIYRNTIGMCCVILKKYYWRILYEHLRVHSVL